MVTKEIAVQKLVLVLFVFLFGDGIQSGLFRRNDGAVQCLGFIDHHAGNLIASLNCLQPARGSLGCQLNLLQRTLGGRKIVGIQAQLLQRRANLVVQALVPIHQILLLVRKQLAVAVGCLHVGYGLLCKDVHKDPKR